MCSTTDHAIDIGFFDVKIYVKSVQAVQMRAFAQDVVNHLDVCASLLLILGSVATDLDTS